jgi:signal transduction histidine kinase/CheY-like chemotaxis protein
LDRPRAAPNSLGVLTDPVGSVQGRTLLLIVLMLLTTALIAAVLLTDSARRYRESTERQLAGTARTLSLAIDGEIGKADAILRTLASSDALKSGDFAALDRQARTAITDQAMWVVVTDETGQQKLNTLKRFGDVLPVEDGSTFQPRWARLLREGQYVSSLRRGVAYPGYIIGLNVLAVGAGGRRYDLTVVIRPEVISRLLTRQALPAGWYSGVLDPDGRIIGRNVTPERYTGQFAMPDMLKAMKLKSSGIRESVSLEGVKTLSAFTRSSLTGWTVAVAMPRSEATGYLSRSLRLLALGSLALLLLGGVLGLILARGTARAVNRAVIAARQLGAGDPLPAQGSPTGLLETDQIVEAMREASQQLQARESELKALNETLEHRVEENAARLVQAQKIDTLGQLTGGVAHDFNNLLSPIIGGLDRLQRGGLSEERAQRSIAGALEAAERAKTLVQRLLAFARRQPLQLRPIDVGACIDGLSELISSTLGPRVDIRLDIAPGLPSATADANQLELALLNLVVNARDAMPDGGVLRIAADAQTVVDDPLGEMADGDYVRLSIIDNGEGMDETVLSRAVEPFFSTKGVGRGTGLGLSMVHGLAAQLGGALRLSSRPGEGATVELWLPRAEAPHLPEAAETPPAGAVTSGAVLLVEDDALVRASTAAMLGDLGYVVLEAVSASEALALMEGGVGVDLLVSDHLMPGMTGADLARKVRERWPGVPVLIISGYAEVEAIAPDLPRLVKPFRQADLAQALSRLTARTSVAGPG